MGRVFALRTAIAVLAVGVIGLGLETVASAPAQAAPAVAGEVRDGEAPDPIASESRDFGSEFPWGGKASIPSRDELARSSDGTAQQGGSALVAQRPEGNVKRGREVEALRSAYGETYETEDGGYVSDMGLEPKRWKDRDGKWQAIDNSIVKSSDGTLKNAGSVFDVHFAPSDIGVRYSVEGYEAGFSFESERVVTPVVDPVDPATVWYHGLWDGVDVSYTVHNNGVKEAFVVRDREALLKAGGFPTIWTSKGAVVVDEEFGGGGLRLDWDRDGKYALGDGQPLMVLEPLIVQDSSGAIQQKSGAVLVAKASDGLAGQRFVVELDREWVSSLSEDAFPLLVDPNVAISPADAGGYWRSYDAVYGNTALRISAGSDGR